MPSVSTPARATATCPHCDSSRLMRITMTLTDGSVVDFASCLRCERRTWTHGDNDLSVGDVLERAKKPAKTSR